ncbi:MULTISPECIES: hypothetical protein [Rhizobium]|uniref:hypothetical protein n=1 Tax=Rhizobium TaxID=379 RepID=UPI00140AA963|nr:MULTISPECIES: hypothetical protein [Rhizobium]MDG3578382.1 hypothetical protein [Rhizobium sp. YJ-22]
MTGDAPFDLPPFEPLDRPLHLTKAQGAARQTYFALGALHAGDYDAAITLAGAAEGMLPGDPDIEVTTQLLKNPTQEVPPPYKWTEIVNLERNWLKHQTDVEKIPAEITFDLDTASFAVFRATRKLPLEYITIEMVAFDEWYRKRVAGQIAARGTDKANG